jgi:hypothetical protein
MTKYVGENPLSRDDAVKVIFAGVLLIEIGFMIAVVFGRISVNEPTAVNDMLLGAILATISAYILYWQTQIQREQTQIEEKMLEYETKPVLEVVDAEFDKNDLILTITNYGHGVAVDLKLNCLVETQDVDWFRGVVSQTPLKKSDGAKVLEDTSVRPQEEPREYIAQSVTAGRKLDSDNGEDHSSIETLMNEMVRQDVRQVSVSLWITGRPKVGNYNVKEKVCHQFVVDPTEIVDNPELQRVYQFQK